MVIQEISLFNEGKPSGGYDYAIVPEAGEIFKYRQLPAEDGSSHIDELIVEISDGSCTDCYFENVCGEHDVGCGPVVCDQGTRFDERDVIFKKVSECIVY